MACYVCESTTGHTDNCSQNPIQVAAREREAAEAARQEEARAGALAKEAAAAARFRQRITVALDWNVAVIAIGCVIAFCAILAWMAASPGESGVLRQTVAALWLIQGLVGLLIAAVGLLGATLAHALRYDQ